MTDNDMYRITLEYANKKCIKEINRIAKEFGIEELTGHWIGKDLGINYRASADLPEDAAALFLNECEKLRCVKVAYSEKLDAEEIYRDAIAKMSTGGIAS